MHIDTGNFEGHRSVIAMSWPCLLMLLVLGITGNWLKFSQSGGGVSQKTDSQIKCAAIYSLSIQNKDKLGTFLWPTCGLSPPGERANCYIGISILHFRLFYNKQINK